MDTQKPHSDSSIQSSSDVNPSTDKVTATASNSNIEATQTSNNAAHAIVSSSFLSDKQINELDKLHKNEPKLNGHLFKQLKSHKKISIVIFIACLVILIGSLMFANGGISRLNPVASSHDSKIIADLKTIDNYIEVNQDTLFNGLPNKGGCDTAPNGINNSNIPGLNYPQSSYQVTDLAADSGGCAIVTYNICATFDTSTWNSSSSSENEPQGDYSKHGKGLWCFMVDDNGEPYDSDSGVTSLSPAALAQQSGNSLSQPSQNDQSTGTDQSVTNNYTGQTDTISGSQLLSDFTTSYGAQAKALGISSSVPALTKSCTDTEQATNSGSEVYDCTIAFSNNNSYDTYAFTATTDPQQAETLMQSFIKVAQSQGFTQSVYKDDELVDNSENGTFQYQASDGYCTTGISYQDSGSDNVNYNLECEAQHMTSVPSGFSVASSSNQ